MRKQAFTFFALKNRYADLGSRVFCSSDQCYHQHPRKLKKKKKDIVNFTVNTIKHHILSRCVHYQNNLISLHPPKMLYSYKSILKIILTTNKQRLNCTNLSPNLELPGCILSLSMSIQYNWINLRAFFLSNKTASQIKRKNKSNFLNQQKIGGSNFSISSL